jgi:hypothetical protein
VTKGLILGVCPAAVASAAIPRSLATWLHQSRVTGHTELGINGIEQLRNTPTAKGLFSRPVEA